MKNRLSTYLCTNQVSNSSNKKKRSKIPCLLKKNNFCWPVLLVCIPGFNIITSDTSLDFSIHHLWCVEIDLSCQSTLDYDQIMNTISWGEKEVQIGC